MFADLESIAYLMTIMTVSNLSAFCQKMAGVFFTITS